MLYTQAPADGMEAQVAALLAAAGADNGAAVEEAEEALALKVGPRFLWKCGSPSGLTASGLRNSCGASGSGSLRMRASCFVLQACAARGTALQGEPGRLLVLP